MDEVAKVYFSFIVRCWSGPGGGLHGVVIDAISRKPYPYLGRQELVGIIERLAAQAGDPDDEPAASPGHLA